MQVIPAIDLRDGACVQLVGGSYADERVRIANPVAVAVLKRARIDLIEDAVAPPIHLALCHVGEPTRKSASRERTRKQRPGSNQQANWDGRVTTGCSRGYGTNLLLGGMAKIGIVRP